MIKLQVGTNRDFQMHKKERLLVSKLLGKCGKFWSQLASKIETFHLHLATKTYGDSAPSKIKEKCCTVVLTMVTVIWRELRNVRMEDETAYGSDD